MVVFSFCLQLKPTFVQELYTSIEQYSSRNRNLADRIASRPSVSILREESPNNGNLLDAATPDAETGVREGGPSLAEGTEKLQNSSESTSNGQLAEGSQERHGQSSLLMSARPVTAVPTPGAEDGAHAESESGAEKRKASYRGGRRPLEVSLSCSSSTDLSAIAGSQDGREDDVISESPSAIDDDSVAVSLEEKATAVSINDALQNGSLLQSLMDTEIASLDSVKTSSTDPPVNGPPKPVGESVDDVYSFAGGVILFLSLRNVVGRSS